MIIDNSKYETFPIGNTGKYDVKIQISMSNDTYYSQYATKRIVSKMSEYIKDKYSTIENANNIEININMPSIFTWNIELSYIINDIFDDWTDFECSQDFRIFENIANDIKNQISNIANIGDKFLKDIYNAEQVLNIAYQLRVAHHNYKHILDMLSDNPKKFYKLKEFDKDTIEFLKTIPTIDIVANQQIYDKETWNKYSNDLRSNLCELLGYMFFNHDERDNYWAMGKAVNKHIKETNPNEVYITDIAKYINDILENTWDSGYDEYCILNVYQTIIANNNITDEHDLELLLDILEDIEEYPFQDFEYLVSKDYLTAFTDLYICDEVVLNAYDECREFLIENFGDNVCDRMLDYNDEIWNDEEMLDFWYEYVRGTLREDYQIFEEFDDGRCIIIP